MTMTIKKCAKTTSYTFDGFSDERKAFVQGAFCGTYYVPHRYEHMIDVDNYAGDTLHAMYSSGKFRISLRNYRFIK